jgi:formate dehydrogenase alpha subunit
MSFSVVIDGRAVDAHPGESVLDAVNRSGIYLPQLCKDPDQPRLGTCRTCLVEIEGMRGTPAACSIPVVPDMVINTDSPQVERIRRGVLQLTLDMLPASSGEPQALGDLAVAVDHYGLHPGRFPAATWPERSEVDASNPFWLLDYSRCILCERCVAACQDVQHISAIALIGRSDDERVGTFRLGPIADSVCTSCGQCWAACPTGAIRLKAPVGAANGRLRRRKKEAPVSRDEVIDSRPLPEVARRVETVCPYCGVGCGIALGLSGDGLIVEVDDVPANESSQGMLCVKGRFGVGFVNSPDRLTTPLIRNAEGALEPASWDVALDLVANEFVRHRGRFAVVGSAKATNEDGYVLQKFARLLMGTNNIDHCARLCHSPSVVALMDQFGSASTTNSYADYERAGCLMVVGSDPDTNHPVISARLRKGVIEHGARLVVVNPRRIRLCDIADLWLRPNPGTDVALFNGLAAIALEEDLWDAAFVAARTEGFDAWRASLAPYTSAAVAAITGVPEVDLQRAARLFARPERGNSCLLWGMGITQHAHGTANVRAMINLALLTGQVGKPGSGLSPLRGQNNVQGCGDSGVLPNHLPGYQGLGPEALKRFRAAWGGDVPAQPGLALTQFFDAAADGEITALYVTGENPLLSEPNIAHAREAMQSLAFLVVQTLFLNETTELAHVVLPAASFAEKDGTFTNSERRVQRVRRALDPPGEARSDWWITSEIARRVAARLGLPSDQFDYRHPDEIYAELARLVTDFAGIRYERLEQGGIQWPCPTEESEGTPLLFAESFPRGRAKLVVVDQGAPAEELPDSQYPFILNTGRVLYHWHGGDLSRQVPGLVALYPNVEVSLHPDDAARLLLADRAPVRVTSRRGSLVGVAHVTDAMRPGEIFIPFVRLQATAANFLTNDVYDPQARIPEYKVCAVRLEPAEERNGA